MSVTVITCELVDERDLDTRYLAGKLSPEEAELFEGHFFGCERCWDLVRQGLALQSVFQADAASSASRGRVAAPPRRARRPWWGLAAAAGIAVVALGIWQLGPPPGPSAPNDVLRGEAKPLLVSATAGRTIISAAWPKAPDADMYRVRLYQADGIVAFERETSDTLVSVPVDSISKASRAGEMFWQVQAFDRVRNAVARSDLTRAVLPEP
jgi:hypothetical protein